MLTDAKVRAEKPDPTKGRKVVDGGGLHLFITPKGHKSWRYRYNHSGKEKLLVLGQYPEMSLAAARVERDEARRTLRGGLDPLLERKRSRATAAGRPGGTFEELARAWHAMQMDRWKPVHANDVITSMERDLFPAIGAFPVATIDEPVLLAALRQVEKRGAIETAHRLRQRADSVFKYAKGEGYPNTNPAVDVANSLKKTPKAKRSPSIIDLERLRGLMAAVDRHESSPVGRLASRFLGITAQRPGMVRRARWADFEGIDWANEGDAVDALWRVPALDMKLEFDMREDEAFEHEVPLPRQAVEALRAVRPLSGSGPLVFPNNRAASSPLSENTIGYLYNRIGYKGVHVPHGWRSSFSTIMNEALEREHGLDVRTTIDRLIIDLMLAHRPRGMSDTEFIYNRAKYMPRRRELATQWADLLMAGLPHARTLLEGRRRAVR